MQLNSSQYLEVVGQFSFLNVVQCGRKQQVLHFSGAVNGELSGKEGDSLSPMFPTIGETETVSQRCNDPSELIIMLRLLSAMQK